MSYVYHATLMPIIGESSKVSSHSNISGNVRIGDKCSVFPFATLRGDVNYIIIGNQTNIQENAIVHVSSDYPVNIGDNVTVGHGAIIHGCHIESDCLIGMHATLMDGVHIGHHCIVGAQTLVTQNTNIPPYSLVLGSPGKVVRTLNAHDLKLISDSAQVYIDGLAFFHE